MTYTMRYFGLTFKSVPLFCNNTSAINLAKNLCFYGKVKHIEVRHHFLRDNVEKGEIVMRELRPRNNLLIFSPSRLMLRVLLPFVVSLAFATPMACSKGEHLFLVQSCLSIFIFFCAIMSYHIITLNS